MRATIFLILFCFCTPAYPCSIVCIDESGYVCKETAQISITDDVVKVTFQGTNYWYDIPLSGKLEVILPFDTKQCYEQESNTIFISVNHENLIIQKK